MAECQLLLFILHSQDDMINFFLLFQIGSADKDTPYDPRDPRPEWPYQPVDQSTSPPSRPEQYKVAIGDRTKISCSIENQNKRTSWRRQDGGPLPRNSHLSGGDLIIEYTQDDAAGVYECVVHEPNGDYPIVTTELVVVGKCLRLKLNLVRFDIHSISILFRIVQNCQESPCIRRCH